VLTNILLFVIVILLVGLYLEMGAQAGNLIKNFDISVKRGDSKNRQVDSLKEYDARPI